MMPEEAIKELLYYEVCNSWWVPFMFTKKMTGFAGWYYSRKVARKINKYHKCRKLFK